MNLDIGTQVGDYRILSRAGRGAYGIVFEAEHVITRRVDAVKLMLDAGPSAEDEEQRFLREIQVQASLRHDNIAQVYTAFRTPWGLALAMEMVPGAFGFHPPQQSSYPAVAYSPASRRPPFA